jgi:hypothetical protein
VDHHRDEPGGNLSAREAELGRNFATALASKDFDRVKELVDPEVDFRGLTPSRAWEASNPDELIANVLTSWFEESDHVEELMSVETGDFADCQRLVYSLRGHNPDGAFTVEQQAYFTERDGRITWMRVVCSGFRFA